MARTLVLLRHGQSEFNAQNRFTGWADPPLTDKGVSEAEAAGALLVSLGIPIGTIFSSTLRRAQRTAEIVQAAFSARPGLVENPALNERDYGDLTGLDKDAAIRRWGEDQVLRWRRSYASSPPGGESLKDTAARVLLFYLQQILPVVMSGSPALVIAHGNSLRALAMALEHVDPVTVESLELATGEIRIYQLRADTSVEGLRIVGSDMLPSHR